MLNEKEIWKDYPEYPDRYEVSNYGKVRSKSFLKKTANLGGYMEYWTKPKLIKQFLNKQGYYQVRLMVDGHKFTRTVHRIVAFTFLGPGIDKNVVNHKNSKRDDNRADNLEWCTVQENVIHSFAIGGKSLAGEKHPGAILMESDVLKIRELKNQGMSTSKISSVVGFKYQTVWKVVKGKNWSHVK